MSHRSVRSEREYVVRLAVAAALAVVGSACSDDDGAGPLPDAGSDVVDSGSAGDAGVPQHDGGASTGDAGSGGTDAGTPATDAGTSDSDAGTPPTDAGSPDTDAGSETPDAGDTGDAGTGDGGSPDAGPTTPWIDVTSQVIAPDDSIVVTFANGPGNALDWIGLYRYSTSSNAYEVPGTSGVTSVTYAYVGGATSGSVTLDPSGSLAPGVYFVGFFENDGFTEIAPRVLVYVGAVPTLTGPTEAYDASRDAYVFSSDGSISVSWSGAAALQNDWIGLFAADATPGASGVASISYRYVAGQESGTATFGGLSAGEYFVTYLVHDYSYFEPAPRVRVIVEP